MNETSCNVNIQVWGPTSAPGQVELLLLFKIFDTLFQVSQIGGQTHDNTLISWSCIVTTNHFTLILRGSEGAKGNLNRKFRQAYIPKLRTILVCVNHQFQ